MRASKHNLYRTQFSSHATMTDHDTHIHNLRHKDPTRRRQAIVTLTRGGVQDAVPAIRHIAKNDPVPELRILAAKALKHLQQPPETQALDDPLGIDAAQKWYIEALRTFKERGSVPAVYRPLSRALRRDPTLRDDELARKMASKLTGLHADAAVDALIAADQLNQAPRSDHGGWLPRQRRRSRVHLTVIFMLFFAVMMVFLQTGFFDYYLNSIQSGMWRENLQTEGPQNYYLIVPEGQPPPNGWPLLVALPEHGASADTLLSVLAEPARDAGLIFVVPTFTEYRAPLSDRTTPAIDTILIEVRDNHPVDSRGAVLLGQGIGGEVATLYAQEYFQVAGVITISALRLYRPPIGDPSVSYLLMYTQNDVLLDYNTQLVEEFRSAGNAVDFRIMPGRVDEITDEEVQLSLQFIRAIFE